MWVLTPWTGQAQIFRESRCHCYLCLLEVEVHTCSSVPSFRGISQWKIQVCLDLVKSDEEVSSGKRKAGCGGREC